MNLLLREIMVEQLNNHSDQNDSFGLESFKPYKVGMLDY